MGLDGRTVLGYGPLTIPAHPFAVNDDGAPDWVSQRVLTQYYLAAGVSGLAVGVHTTQFEIHHDQDLFRRTLMETSEITSTASREVALLAGVCGDIPQAVAEAELAADLGYGSVLLCPYGVTDQRPAYSLERARQVAEVLPVVGFYMQESVGGAFRGEDYWSELFSIDGVVGVKIAPFDRYRTRDVMAALAASSRANEIVVLTGNDDTIISDLVTPYRYPVPGGSRALRFTGGLLGQWAVGTRAAVELTRRAHLNHGGDISEGLLADGVDLVTINQAVFDPDNNFVGAVAGVNEMLRQQGLLRSSRCLSPAEKLSPGQQYRIERARIAYPELLDEEFIRDFIGDWRSAAA